VLAAHFIDRSGKGIRDAPRDALRINHENLKNA